MIPFHRRFQVDQTNHLGKQPETIQQTVCHHYTSTSYLNNNKNPRVTPSKLYRKKCDSEEITSRKQ